MIKNKIPEDSLVERLNQYNGIFKRLSSSLIVVGNDPNCASVVVCGLLLY